MTMPFPLSDPPDEQTSELGRKMFAGPVEFLKGVVAMSGLPDADRLEVCFAGRSNVGKSSLINAITGRKAIARASNTPGRTQEINFFTLGESHYLVDLPGYGYANAPLAKVEAWQRLLKQYLSGRPNLRRAFVLIDARHGIKDVDEEIMSLLDSSAVTFQCVLTKVDQLKGIGSGARKAGQTSRRLSGTDRDLQRKGRRHCHAARRDRHVGINGALVVKISRQAVTEMRHGLGVMHVNRRRHQKPFRALIAKHNLLRTLFWQMSGKKPCPDRLVRESLPDQITRT